MYPGITLFGCVPSNSDTTGTLFLSTVIGFPLASTNVVTGRTVGVYVLVNTVPFVSFTCTVTPEAFPTKFGSGVNVITLFANV